MITQAMRNWLRRIFAWWPWRQESPAHYRQASGPLSAVTPTEGNISLSAVDSAAPQASVTPRLSTIEERPGHVIQAPSTSPVPLDTPLAPGESPPLPATPAISTDLPAPTPQQRLEFLRYLVKRGLVNEGHEER